MRGGQIIVLRAGSSVAYFANGFFWEVLRNALLATWADARRCLRGSIRSTCRGPRKR